MTRVFLDDNNKEIIVSFINKTYDLFEIGSKDLMSRWQKNMLFEIEDKYYMEVYNNNQKYRKLIEEAVNNCNFLFSQKVEQLANRVFDSDHPRYIYITPDSPNDNYEVKVDMLLAHVYFTSKE